MGTIAILMSFAALATDPIAIDEAARLAYNRDFAGGSTAVSVANVSSHENGQTYDVSLTATDKDEGTSIAITTASATGATNNDDVLSTNNLLSVNQRTTATVTAALPDTTDSDDAASMLPYNITAGPTDGKVLLASGATTAFTQADIHAGLLACRHDGIQASSDGISFAVDDGQSTTTSETLLISARTGPARNEINIDQNWLKQRGDGPYYLDKANKRYVLQTDVSTDGTAFAIIAPDVTFDLNGHTITYDNADPIAIPNASFEEGSGGVATYWDFSSAPNATRHQGVWLHNEVYDGDHSLKFTLPANDQHVVSRSTIALEANTKYSLSAMFEYGGKGDTVNPGAKGYVRLVGDGLPTREVSWDATNWRGIQLRESDFTTGNTAESYYVQVGVEAAKSLDPAAAKPLYIDDIKVQRTEVYGVTTAAYDWSLRYPNVRQFGRGTNATIKNGTIVQGSDGATWGHGIFIHTVNGVTVHNLKITVQGANSSAIYGLHQADYVSTIHSNTLTSNVKTITSRDNFHGAVIHRLQGDIYNNTITNGIHAGIVTANGTPQQRVVSNVHGNTIQLSSRYTNGFAITGSWGSEIHDNLIKAGTGEFAARGIGIGGGDVKGATTRVYNNTIHAQQLINNQEYEGQQLGGGYGIQLEDARNVEVYGNNVFVYGNKVSAYAFRMNGEASAAIHVHDNTFRAISNGARAATTKFSEIGEGSVLFENNALITNDQITGKSNDSAVTLKRSIITINAPVANAEPFEAAWSSSSSLHTTIKLLDTVFADVASREYVQDAVVTDSNNKMAFQLDWTTTIQVSDPHGAALASVQVVIKDKGGNDCFIGNTNVNGQVVVALSEFRIQGATKTTCNPYRVTASLGGDVTTLTFNADQAQTLELQIGTND